MGNFSVNKLKFYLPYYVNWFIKDRIIDTPFFKYLYNKKVKEEIRNLKRKKFLPQVVYLETTNICNAHCIMCPRDKMTRKIGFMDMNLYKAIVSECADLGIREIRLHNFGEPLLDTLLYDRIKYAKTKGIPKVLFYTNGSLLNSKAREEIINAGLDEIFVSIDGSDKIEYERIRRGLNYEEVVANIKELCKMKRNLRIEKPIVRLFFTCIFNGKCFSEKRDEIKKFKLKWQELVDSILVTKSHDWAGRIKKGSVCSHIHKWPCMYLWKAMTILWDGRVSLCCMDFNGENILGNANKNRLQDIWNNDLYRKAREAHLNEKSDKISLCRNCSIDRLWSNYD